MKKRKWYRLLETFFFFFFKLDELNICVHIIAKVYKIIMRENLGDTKETI